MPVMPCHDCANPTTSQPPVTSFASLIAASLVSPPVDNSITFGSCHQLGQSLGEIDHRPAQHRGEQVIEPADAVAYRRDDLRVRMAAQGTHLARGEVQHGPARGIVEKHAFGPNRYEVDELAAVFDQVTP